MGQTNALDIWGQKLMIKVRRINTPVSFNAVARGDLLRISGLTADICKK